MGLETWFPTGRTVNAARCGRVRRLAWRNRALSALVVAASLGGSRLAIADPVRRAACEQSVIVALGFAHLLAAWAFSRVRDGAGAPRPGPGWLATPLLGSASLGLFAAFWLVFGPALQGETRFLLPFVVANVWHVVENDLALARAYGRRARLAPLGSSGAGNALALALSACLLCVAMASDPHAGAWGPLRGGLFDGLPAVPFEGIAGLGLDPTLLFAGLTLYHLISWLVFFSDRVHGRIPGAAPRDVARARRLLASTHAPVLLLAAWLLSRPEGPWKSAGILFFSWASYLFWSTLHVFQTILARRRASSRVPVPGRGLVRVLRLAAAWSLALAAAAAPAIAGALWLCSGRVLRPAGYVHPGPDAPLADPPPELRRLYQQRLGDPLTEFGLAFEHVTFAGPGGSALRGWFVPAGRPARTGIVTVHGAWLDRRDFTRRLPFLHGAGYPVLMFDCREHGRSTGSGRGATFGQRERLDVSAAVAHLRAARGLDRVVVFGESQGAAAAILAAAEDPGIDALVLENAFASFDPIDLAGAPLPGRRRLPGFVARPLTWAVERRIGFPRARHPVEVIGRIAPRPILLLHGSEDRVISFEHSRRLHAAAGAPKTLWIAPHAAHDATINRFPEEYARRILGFLGRHAPASRRPLAAR